MRPILILLLLALPVQAQSRVFRASSIDLEQDARLDALDAKAKATDEQVAEVTAALASLSAKLGQINKQLSEAKPAISDALAVAEKIDTSLKPKMEAPVVAKPTLPPPQSRPAAILTPPPPQQAVSPRYSTAELRSMIQRARPGGWRGPVFADVSPRSAVKQHLVGPEHGFSWDQVNGLSHEEALILHDLAPRHGNQIFPIRSQRQPARATVAAAVPQMQVQTYARQYTQPASSGCANGQCANTYRSSGTTSRGGLFGFGILGRR